MYSFYEMRDSVTDALANKNEIKLQRLMIMDKYMFNEVIKEIAKDMEFTPQYILKDFNLIG